MIAGASHGELESITAYATNLGLMFQITDDLLDVTATAEDLGKTPGKDARAQKATFPALYGIEATRERLVVAHRAACRSFEQIDRSTQRLASVAAFVLEREA